MGVVSAPVTPLGYLSSGLPCTWGDAQAASYGKGGGGAEDTEAAPLPTEERRRTLARLRLLRVLLLPLTLLSHAWRHPGCALPTLSLSLSLALSLYRSLTHSLT